MTLSTSCRNMVHGRRAPMTERKLLYAELRNYSHYNMST